jgi:PHP family Zn ribbon phosphoesterase
LDLPLAKLSGKTYSLIIEGIRRVRAGELNIKPGFDGRYGEISIFSDKEKSDGKKQNKFF